MTCFDLSVYLVLDPALCAGAGLAGTARAAVEGGVTMVQLRHKQASTAELVAAGLAVKSALAGTPARFLVNDDVDAAVAIGADGVHIGQDDGDPREVRRRIGPARILGLSAETEERAAAIDPAVVDYAGFAPVFATPTKPDYSPPLGLDGLARLVARSRVPGVAIGGLDASHAEGVLAAGARGLAVVSAICGRPDPRAAAAAIARAVARARA